MVTTLTPTAAVQEAAVTLSAEAISAFGAGLRGAVLRPGDGGYDDARTVWNAMIDRKPALIVRCAGVADVVAAVAFARDHGLAAAVRGGGHNVAGTALSDGGLVIDLTPMKGIRVDPQTRTARAEGGVTWGELDQETQVFGLATTGGVIPTTGIGGLTLGGGIGWIMRKHGLSCDNLLSADVVTADGQFVTASATEHPDLFWAIRGGGGNFGVVTSLEFQLHDVGPTLVAGPLFHPLARAGEALRFVRDRAASQPDELICHAGLLTSPDGDALAAMIPAYVGPVPDGEAAVGPFRAFGPPVADMLGPVPYRVLQTFFNAAFPDGRRNYWKSAFVPELTDTMIDLMVEGYASAPSPYATLFLEQCGGKVNRVGVSDTAFPHRAAAYNFLIANAWEDPHDDEVNLRWVRQVWTAMLPHLGDGVYVNYLSDPGYEGEQRVRAAYGPNYDRLAALKRRYDPANLFRHNQNIVPAST